MLLPTMSLELGSAPAERVGLGWGWGGARVGLAWVGGFQHWAQATWLLLGLAVESPWSALGGPFLTCTNGLKKWSLAM